ncbi:uncharacterized protein LTR77_000779 [Saxophila tyrrhenica]|uniref:UBC core domain-containing protein n=1 Tax=Saxophila tyrrhenica TaxID=1690608 RepID=A0AAV9PTI0_9PEZI|nr:hypothetical protein LTR77_000779 [Saxophila tyrrhenica]
MPAPLFPDDLVANKDGENDVGVVEGTHGDVDTHLPHPARNSADPIVCDGVPKKLYKRFLKDGVPPPNTVFVRWHRRMESSLIHESKLKLLDRSLLIGDIVKRNVRDAMSGTVINASTRLVLQPLPELQLPSLRGNNTLRGWPAFGNELSVYGRYTTTLPQTLVDVPASELRYADALNVEDLFVYKNHLGRIEKLVQMVTLQLADNNVVEIHEGQARHHDDALDQFYVGDIAYSKKPDLRRSNWIFGQYNPNTPPIGTVVATRNVSADVEWLQRRIGAVGASEPALFLDSDDLESEDFRIYDCSRRPRTTGATSTTLSNPETDFGLLGVVVRFKDLAGACVKYDGSTHHGKLHRLDRRDTLGYDLNVFRLEGFQTDVTIQWQDLSISQERSIDLVPDSSIDDDHAAWPGEIAHTLDFSRIPGTEGMSQPSKVGVVQTVNPTERMATMRWCSGGCMQYFQDLEEGNEMRSLILGLVGRADGEQEEMSLYDVDAPGSMNVRRGDKVLLMDEARSQKDGDDEKDDVDWIGEIVDTCLDGTLTIRLGAAKEVRDIQVLREHVRVAIRSDGTGEPDGWEQGASDEETTDEEVALAMERDGLGLGEPYGVPGDPGYLHPDFEGWGSEDDYLDFDNDSMERSEDDESVNATYEDENGVPLDEEEVENEDWESDASGEEDVNMIDVPDETPPTSHPVTPPHNQTNADPDGNVGSDAMKENTTNGPEQYLVLEGPAPTSHHYSNQPSTNNATHMKRVQKEHKILRTAGNLPPEVYVRTWDSRMDLIRVLFVGPAETPYADAPFVVDFYLPSTFPTDPPHAHFHNWTAESSLGGVGRVNPNLYEDGKICLSLLGTWDGAKNESWSPARSTLLQVIVSILGLVLVREPYFNEAGYEPLADLESSKRPSALYNERTYLRANSFIINAVDRINASKEGVRGGVEGLEDVFHWLYKDASGKQLLDRKIQDVEEVLKRSESGAAEPDGLRSMSKGACIPLRRVLARLKEL